MRPGLQTHTRFSILVMMKYEFVPTKYFAEIFYKLILAELICTLEHDDRKALCPVPGARGTQPSVRHDRAIDLERRRSRRRDQ